MNEKNMTGGNPKCLSKEVKLNYKNESFTWDPRREATWIPHREFVPGINMKKYHLKKYYRVRER